MLSYWFRYEALACGPRGSGFSHAKKLGPSAQHQNKMPDIIFKQDFWNLHQKWPTHGTHVGKTFGLGTQPRGSRAGWDRVPWGLMAEVILHRTASPDTVPVVGVKWAANRSDDSSADDASMFVLSV